MTKEKQGGVRTVEEQDTFGQSHPAVVFVYFLLVLGCTMSLLHPACLAVSLTGALGYSLRLYGARAAARGVLILGPVTALAALLNPLFNHRGATVLLYFPGGNPLTLESLAYGAALAAALGCALGWFSCYQRVFPADRLLFLLGRAAPSVALFLSLSLGFVPKLLRRIQMVDEARRGLWDEPPLRRMGRTAACVTAWALEQSAATADAMGGRGYGLPGRTAFSRHTFRRRDAALLAFLLLCGGYVAAGAGAGALEWHFFPTLGGTAPAAYPLSVWGAYLALCLTPVWTGWKEGRKWKAMNCAT